MRWWAAALPRPSTEVPTAGFSRWSERLGNYSLTRGFSFPRSCPLGKELWLSCCSDFLECCARLVTLALPASPALQDGAAEARVSPEQPLEPWYYQVHGCKPAGSPHVLLASKGWYLWNYGRTSLCVKSGRFVCLGTTVPSTLSKCFVTINLINTVSFSSGLENCMCFENMTFKDK